MENQNQSQENIKSDSEILSELRMLALQMSLVKKTNEEKQRRKYRRTKGAEKERKTKSRMETWRRW